METEFSNRLPVPDIREESFQYSYKQAHRRDDFNRLKPPKIKPRYDSNCNRDHTAHAISFRGDVYDGLDESSLLCSSYDSSLNETYFEQCFIRLAKIGEGSFGEVFKVRSKEDGFLYAVKMSKQLLRRDCYRQERLEEVRRYEQFSGHANCLQFYRAWEQDDRLYMQMELCRESLEAYLERKRNIPEAKIWSILLDLLLALKSLHDRNLLHLDIKLDNVLIAYDDICKLADFGLVIDVDRANRHQATEGDSRYVAPEIMQGNFSKAADIFSLGIAMLELSCYLELPTNGPLWQQLRSAVWPENFLCNISPDLSDIIKDMMTPDPRQRPTVDQLLAHKQLVAILPRRKWCALRQKINQSLRKIHGFGWSKLASLAKLVSRFLAWLWNAFGYRNVLRVDNQNEYYNLVHTKAQHILTPNTPTMYDTRARSPENLHFDECLHPFSGVGSIVNSTPVNHSNNSGRFGKPLTKNNLDPSSSALYDNLLTYDDCNDSDIVANTPRIYIRKHLDISSMRKKKLF